MTDRPGLDFSFSGAQDPHPEHRHSSVSTMPTGQLDDQSPRRRRQWPSRKPSPTPWRSSAVGPCKQTGLHPPGGGRRCQCQCAPARQAGRDATRKQGARALLPSRPRFCTDNGAMIAYAGCSAFDRRRSRTIVGQMQACSRAGRWIRCRRCRVGRYGLRVTSYALLFGTFRCAQGALRVLS